MNCYELIVLDLNLPDMDGMAIFGALRAVRTKPP